MQLQFEEYASSGPAIRRRPSLSKGRDEPKIILKTRHNKRSLNARVKTALPKHQRVDFAEPKEAKLGPRLALEFTRMISSNQKIDLSSTKKKIVQKNASPIHRLQQICYTQFNEKQEAAAECDETLTRNSSKVKLFYNNCRQNLKTVLILSAEFLLNEFSFWKEDEIDSNIARIYRSMSQNNGMVWLVKKEKTANKIVQFCNKNFLPLDSIYLIQKSKKMSISVNYEPIVKDLSHAKNFIAFDIVRIHSSSEIQNCHHIQNKLPLTSNANIKLHLIKSDKDLLPIQLLQNAWQVITGELHSKRYLLEKALSDYAEYLRNYQDPVKASRKKKKASVRIAEQEEEEDPEEDILRWIEQLKRKWVPEMNKNKQFSQGQSVHFIVGDLLKRNFRLMVDLHQQWNKGKDIAECTTAATSLSRRCTVSRVEETHPAGIHYNIPVYVCCI